MRTLYQPADDRLWENGPMARAGPTPPGERLLSLDVLRGVAVLGILLINIQGYSMVLAASVNPMAWGDLTGANLWVFVVSYVLADQEFLTLFAMLFAAGLLFTADRVQARDDAGSGGFAGLHYRRVSVLLLIGLVHAYLIWEDDVLVAYAQVGLLLYPLRNVGRWTLLGTGLATYAVYSGLAFWQGFQVLEWSPEQLQVLEAQWAGYPVLVEPEVRAMRGTWWDQVLYRTPGLVEAHTTRFFFWTLWRVGGVMLIGMALYRFGVLTAERSRVFYLRLALVGIVAGVAVRSIGVWTDFEAGWRVEYSRFFGFQYKYWGSLLLALGYLGLFTWLAQHALEVGGAWLRRALDALARVGRLTLTNYLTQSIVCTAIFYGWGLGWFGSVERTGQLAIVLAIWAGQIAFSWLWTSRFPYGPLEWVWRRLTYLGRPA